MWRLFDQNAAQLTANFRADFRQEMPFAMRFNRIKGKTRYSSYPFVTQVFSSKIINPVNILLLHARTPFRGSAPHYTATESAKTGGRYKKEPLGKAASE